MNIIIAINQYRSLGKLINLICFIFIKIEISWGRHRLQISPPVKSKILENVIFNNFFLIKFLIWTTKYLAFANAPSNISFPPSRQMKQRGIFTAVKFPSHCWIQIWRMKYIIFWAMPSQDPLWMSNSGCLSYSFHSQKKATTSQKTTDNLWTLSLSSFLIQLSSSLSDTEK